MVYYRKASYIGMIVGVFANGPRYLGSIPGRVIPKTQKMVLDASFLNSQHYKVRIKGSGTIQGNGIHLKGFYYWNTLDKFLLLEYIR